MVINDAAQQRYYNEIQDCVRLENIARYIQGQKFPKDLLPQPDAVYRS